jgi:tetratricopeptide (TPR) repeat protein
MGRTEEAKSQFELALALNPNFYSAAFNLGLTYQGMNQFKKAIVQYKIIENASKTSEIKRKVLLDSKIRECDLYQAMGENKEAFDCWSEGIEKFPEVDVFYNGNDYFFLILYKKLKPNIP